MCNIQEVTKFRVFLRTHVYNKETLNILIEYIKQTLDTVESIEQIDSKINIELKKSRSKKINRDSLINNSYNFINQIFFNFISDSRIQRNIESCIPIAGQDAPLLKQVFQELKNGSSISILYNATTISPNNIIIYL